MINRIAPKSLCRYTQPMSANTRDLAAEHILLRQYRTILASINHSNREIANEQRNLARYEANRLDIYSKLIRQGITKDELDLYLTDTAD